jgi:hypothetical protein
LINCAVDSMRAKLPREPMRLPATVKALRQPIIVWAEIALAIGSVAPILGMPIIVGALQIDGATRRNTPGT